MTVKRIIIFLFVAIVLYFWVVSIFSEKNAPGRGGRYVYSNSLDEGEGKKKEPPPEPRPSPPAPGKPSAPRKVAHRGEEKGFVQGKVGDPNIKPPPKRGGSGAQPSMPKPPSNPRPSPVIPATKMERENHTPNKLNGENKMTSPDNINGAPAKSPANNSTGKTPPRQPVKANGEPGESTPNFTPDKDRAFPNKEEASNKAGRTTTKPVVATKSIDTGLIPVESDLKNYFNHRLNIQIACPEKWTVIQSKTQPEFKCRAEGIPHLLLTCRRSRIMEGRKFDDEVDAIVKNEIFGRNLENKKVNSRYLGKYKLTRVTFNEFELDSNEIKQQKNFLIYLFIESGDEISMFYFETPTKYKEKVLPVFEKMIKSIRVVKRPEPAAAGGKKK